MIITLNQKEIESILVDGLVGMGILHGKEAKVTMVAGRSPAGMTAEVKFDAPVIVEGTIGPGPSGFSSAVSAAAIPTKMAETYGSSNPEGLPAKTDAEDANESETADKVKPNTPLFGADAKSA